MDHRNHQAVRHRQRLRGAAAPPGGGTNLRMAQPQPTSRQGLRTNHRLSNRLAVHRINPALHTPYRKSMKLHEIVLNQTLRDNAKYSSTNASLLNSPGFTRRPGLSGVYIRFNCGPLSSSSFKRGAKKNGRAKDY